MIAILVVAEHDNNTLPLATLNILAAAKQIGGEIVVLVTGFDAAGVAFAAAQIADFSEVLLADDTATHTSCRKTSPPCSPIWAGTSATCWPRRPASARTSCRGLPHC